MDERIFANEKSARCEWSILKGADPSYNCIAWSIGRTDVWIISVLPDELDKQNDGEIDKPGTVDGVWRDPVTKILYMDIDERYGNGNEKLED
ncbi:MAG: hypothetical protein RMK18_10280 [Armatimonadota bacterium]|nr:hypothetical protein [Armatimonadota bacterium]MDW8026231.1 hypothetical protein [Armatimonadota bacterium]